MYEHFTHHYFTFTLKHLKYFILILISIIVHINSNIIGIEMLPQNTQINLISRYTFTLTRDINPLTTDFVTPSTIQVNSIIQIVFPADYTYIATMTTIPCNNAYTGVSLTCIISQSNKTLTIKDYYKDSSTVTDVYPSIVVYNIINPTKSGQTANFQYFIKAANGTTIDTSPSVTNTIYFPRLSFTPGTFTSCRISASFSSILTRSKLTISLTPKNPIPSSGILTLTLPLYWSNDMENNITLSNTPSCNALSNISTSISCSSNIVAAPVNKVYITVTNLTLTTLNIPFEITVQSILMPAYVDSTDFINVHSAWGDNTQIDTCRTTITDLSPIKFQSISFTSQSNTIVQSSFIGILSITLAKPFSYLDTIIFTVPEYFINSTVTSVSFSSFSQYKDVNGLKISLNNFPTTANKSTNTVVNFTMGNIKNPDSVKEVLMEVKCYRVGSLYQEGTVTYTAQKDTTAQFNLLPQSLFVNDITTVEVKIQTKLKIPVNSIVYIYYPASIMAVDLSQQSVISAFLNGINVNVNNGVKFLTSSNTIMIKNLFKSTTLFTSGNITITLPKFNNPPTIQQTTYLLRVATSDDFTIFSSSYIITSVLKNLISNSVYSSSYKVLDTTRITFQLQLNYPATTISIIIPQQIQIQSGFQSTCLPSNLTSCTFNQLNRNLTFQGNFITGKYNLSWANTINPNSFQATKSFSVFTYYRGWGVEKSLGYVYIQMNQTAKFISILISPSSLKNNQTIDVTFIVNFPSKAPSEGNLVIVCPNQLDLTNVVCNISCIKTSNNLTFSISSLIINSTNNYKFSLLLSSVINSVSFQPLESFILQYKSINQFSSIFSSYSGWTNNIPSQFITYVSTQQSYLNQSSLFKFDINHLTSKQSYLIIQFNDLFGQLSSNTSTYTVINSRRVKYNLSNQLTAQVYLTLVTPQIFGDYTFTLFTYIESNSQSYLISQSVSNIWRHSCYNTVCRACTINITTNNTVCVDCYSKAISQFYIFDSQLETCRRDCQAGYYLINQNVCSPCNSNCLECQNISTNCTACDTEKSLFLDNNYKKCVTVCEDGYYQNIQIQKCIQCNSPCLHCQTSGSKCTYCNTTTFLLHQDCLSSCPSTGQYISNSSSRRCDPCSSNCLTCQNFTTRCTSCNTTLLLYLQYNKCVQKCENNSFIDIGQGKCVKCQTPCNKCYNASNVCATCLNNVTTKYYYNFICVAAGDCPNGNYINIANSSCDTCLSQCSSCSSLTNCTVCRSPYNLHQSSCILTCPNTTYQQNSICVTCTGCLTCTNTYKNCTSCISTQYLYQSLCYSLCPMGTFKNDTLKICERCASDCITCTNYTYCTSCVKQLYYYMGKCYISCPIQSSYENTQLINNINILICTTCPQPCLTCLSESTCQSCKSLYSLQNSTTCVRTCTVGISFNNVCYPCGLNCALCQIQSNKCKLCQTQYFIYDHKCVNTCPSNMLTLDDIVCVSCAVKFTNACTTCNFTHCLSCNEGELTKGECLPCNQGYYSKNSKCTLCPISCKSCYNESSCIQCNPKYYMQKNYCVSTCPLNKIPSGTSCQICLQNCTVCNLTNSLCSICNSGLYLYEHRCVSTCPQPLIINLDASKCVTLEQYYEQYSKQARIVYFPFSISSVILIIIAIVVKMHSKVTHLITLLVAVISVTEIGSWAAFVFVQTLSLLNYHQQARNSLILSIVAIVLLMVLGMIHMKFYCKYIIQDIYFTKWVSKNFIIDKVFLTLSSIFSFKLYRILYSRLLDRDQFSLKLFTLNKLRPFSLLSIISIILCSFPILISSGLALYFSINQDFQFFAALDCLIVTFIMMLFKLLDLRHDGTYFFVQMQSQNIKRYMYQQDDIKVNAINMNQNQRNSQNILINDEKNMSKGQLLEHDNYKEIEAIEEVYGQQTGEKFKRTKRGTKNQTNHLLQTKANTGGFRTTKMVKENIQIQNKQNQDDFEVEIQTDNGDQAIFMPQSHYKQQQLQQQQLQQQQIQSQITQDNKQPKWAPRQYDRFGYLLRKNPVTGQLQKFDQHGYRVQIDQNGVHHKYNSQGEQVQQLKDGKFYVKDKNNQNWYYLNNQKYDRRGYRIKENEKGEEEYYDEKGYRIEQDEQGNIRKYDDYGHQIKVDKQGNIKRYSKQGYQAFVSQSGKITYKDNQGYYVRKNSQGQYQRYDPDDGFIIKVDQQGNVTKYDKFGYRIEKDKWGNITRYDQQGYKIVFGPNDQIYRYDKNNNRVVVLENGEIKLYNKQGYQIRIDEEGKKHLYDSNGYQVIKDYYNNITLLDKNGYRVVIDPMTHKHTKYTKQGLRIQQNKQTNQFKYYDKRNNQVIDFADSLYEKYDQLGNKIYLDDDGMECEYDENNQKIRYDKVGNVVDEEKWREKIEQQIVDQLNQNKEKNIKKRFKNIRQLDYQQQYSKMVQEENNKNTIQQQQQQLLFQQDNLKQFHDILPLNDYDLEIQLQTLKNQQFYHQNQKQFSQDNLDKLTDLKQVDYKVQKQLKQKNSSRNSNVISQIKNNRFKKGQALQNQHKQDDVQLKSLADASVNEQSFQNQGVQPLQDISHNHQQIQLQQQQIQQLSTLNNKVKHIKNQQSESSFPHILNNDTLSQYNHRPINISIKSKNKIYDQSQQIQSLNQDNWVENAEIGQMFTDNYYNNFNHNFNYNKNFSNANTNTNMNQLVFMEDVEDYDQNGINSINNDNDKDKDILTQLVKQTSISKTRNQSLNNNRYNKQHDSTKQYKSKNTIEQMEQELFRKSQQQMFHEDPIQRTEFKLSNTPNPLVEYAKHIQKNKKSLNQKIYLEEFSRKKKRRR